MNIDYPVGNMRIRFASQARRRWFVALLYAEMAVFLLAGLFLSRKDATGAWITAGCGFLYVALWMVFSWIAGDTFARGDEREVHRREHAHFMAYRTLGYFLCCSIMMAVVLFVGPNHISPLLPLALRDFLMQLSFVLLLATTLLYTTLPSAILLWTEPDIEEAE